MTIWQRTSMGEKRSKRKRESELRQFRHFGRVLEYVWPHKRHLVVAILCMIMVAMCYTASIASLYPILKVFLARESLPQFLDRSIAERRLKCQLVVREPAEGQSGAVAVVIADVSAGSPLAAQEVTIGDVIVGFDGHLQAGPDLISALVELPGERQITLQIQPAGSTAMRQVPTTLRAVKWHWKLAHRAAAYLPAEPPGLSDQERVRHRMFILGYILSALVIVALVGNVCRFLGEYYGSVVGALTMLDLRRKMYAKAMTLPMTFYVSNSAADMMSRFIRDTQDVLKALRTLFGKVLREPLKAVAVLVFALYVDYRLTLMVLVVTPIVAWLFRKFGRRIRKANQKLLHAYGRLLGALESTLAGIKVVKAYTMEDRERIRYFRVERRILKQQLRIDMLGALSSPVLEVLAMTAGCAFVFWCARQVSGEKYELEQLLTVVVAMGAMFDPMRKLSNVYNQIQHANAAAKRIFELIDRPSEFQLGDGTRQAFTPKEGIRFENVSFRYPNSDRLVLEDINLFVKPGQVVAVVGPNGSGKTILVSMLMRFFDPLQGRILWDGVDLREFRLRSLRKKIAFVSQETVIFPDTVKANISYGDPSVNSDKIIAAARKAYADEFITNMPEGYDTMIGEQGVRLSGGERQRLAIARAVLRDAPVLIFDEATSQIDAESEQKIQQAIDEIMPGKTAFIIAHRFSTISKADTIVVMDRGRIVASGTHGELIEGSPLYQNLYQTQFAALSER